MGARRHAATASSIPMLGASQHEGATPFDKRRRQPTETARSKLRRQGTAHRLPSAEAQKSPATAQQRSPKPNSKRSGSSTPSAARKLEVQRQAQQQLHATAQRDTAADGALNESEPATNKSLREAAAVSRTKQSTQQNGARRQHDHTRQTKAFKKSNSCMGNKTKARIPNMTTKRGHVP